MRFSKVSYILSLLLIIFANAATAQEIQYEFPYIKPELSLSGGYRLIDHSGSEQASEYEYLNDSITLGSELRAVFYPHRLFIDLDLKNKKDYFGELRYSYKDLLYFRGINRTLFHNLENLRLLDIDANTTPTTSPSGPTVDVRDADEKYGIKAGMNTIFIRFKTPDFPAHLFIEGQLIEKKGGQQQRVLLGSGSTDKIIRNSRSRNVDLQTKNITIGANSHLGPIEIEVSHGEKRFDVNGDRIFYDEYLAAGTPPGSIRIGGIFPTNLMPELKGSTNTIKLHTSYTGGLVASATFSKTERENTDSKARADYLIAAGEIVWMPMPKLTFFIKCRHKEKDIDNPDSIAIPDICNTSNNITNNYSCVISPPLSSTIDTITAIVRYRPINRLTLRAEYSYDEVERENADKWGIPDSTRKNIFSLSSDMRILKTLNFKAKFTHKQIENPAYNNEPDYSNEVSVSASWMPSIKVNTLLSYSISQEKRDDLFFKDANATAKAKDRNTDRQRLLGSITFLVSQNLSVTTTYNHIVNKTTQDILFRAPAPSSALMDSSVPYKDRANGYSIDLYYAPNDNMSFDAGLSHMIMKGNFHPSNPDLLEPVSIAAFSDFKVKETVFYAGGDYRFKMGFIMGLKYRYVNLDEVTKNPHDDIKDGKAHVILLTLSKNW